MDKSQKELLQDFQEEVIALKERIAALEARISALQAGEIQADDEVVDFTDIEIGVEEPVGEPEPVAEPQPVAEPLPEPVEEPVDEVQASAGERVQLEIATGMAKRCEEFLEQRLYAE